VFSAWGICGLLVPGYFEGLLDSAREASNCGNNEVYWKLATLGMIVAILVALLRGPRARAAV